MSGNIPAFTTERLLGQLRQFPAPAVYWLAFSGGADSTALLQALCEIRAHAEVDFRALHVNHGMHPGADDWQRHCERFCSSRDVRLECAKVNVDRELGRGLEAEARRLRYGVAAGLLEMGDILLTAHHADDQAETLMLNLMRGSGVDGLAGMPQLRPLGKGLLGRPLLPFSGRALRTFLIERNIEWIEDTSNTDESYDRNYLRHSLMPVLERRWPGATSKIAQSTAHCREAAGLLGEMADARLEERLIHPQVLGLGALTEPPEFKLIVRRWLQSRQAPALPARQLEELCRQCASATAEQHVKVEWAGWVLQLFRRDLWLQRRDSIAPCPSVHWKTPGYLDLGPVVGQLGLECGDTRLPPGLNAGSRRAGAKIHFAKNDLHKSVKHLLHEAGVPPWLRDSVPLLYLDGEAVALGDWAIGSRLQTWLTRHGARLRWKPADPLLNLVQTGRGRATVDPSQPLG